MILPFFNLRIAASGPTVEASNDGDTLVWDAAAGQWKTGASSGAEVWIQDFIIKSRDDLEAVVAPVGGEFILPAGSYGIKQLTLNAGESLVVDNVSVRLTGNNSSISSVSGVVVDVREGGRLTMDNLTVNGRLVLAGGIDTTLVRANQCVFSRAGDVLDMSGGSLTAVNCEWAAAGATACTHSGGVSRMVGCDVSASGGGVAVAVTDSAVAELVACDLVGGASVSSTLGTVIVNGGKVSAATPVTVTDCDSVWVGGGAVLEGDGTGPGYLLNPATAAREITVSSQRVVNVTAGVDMDTAGAGNIQYLSVDNVRFESLSSFALAASGSSSARARITNISNCTLDSPAAFLGGGITPASVRVVSRANFGELGSDGRVTETTLAP